MVDLAEYPAIIKKDGSAVRTTAGWNFLYTDVIEFAFTEKDPGWVKKKFEHLHPSAPWQAVSVRLLGFNFHFDNGDHQINDIQVLPYVALQQPQTVVVGVTNAIADSGGDDPWRGWVRVGVDYYGN